jgi:hypothetical protein
VSGKKERKKGGETCGGRIVVKNGKKKQQRNRVGREGKKGKGRQTSRKYNEKGNRKLRLRGT